MDKLKKSNVPVVAPAILAYNLDEYRTQIANVKDFAQRIQIDIDDGKFSPDKTVNLAEAHWPDNIQADLHLMIHNPDQRLPEIISLDPDLAIIHVEADGDLVKAIETLKSVDIKTGIALLQKTKVQDAVELIKLVGHVLLFAGNLGKQGADTDMEVLSKVPEIRDINPDLEIGIDGGVKDKNAAEIAMAGVDVLNVGSFIQKADNPKNAYDKLMDEANKAVENES